MRSGDSVKRLVLSVAFVIAGGVASVGLTAPTPAAAATGPQLQVNVVVTPSKATYAVGDAITTTFVITNTGTATATNVRLFGGDEDGVDRATNPPTDQFDLAPGASHSVPWAGTLNQGAAVLGYAVGGWSFIDDQSQTPPAGVLGTYRIAPVPGLTGTLSGNVFIDLQGNLDSTQPGLAGVTVTATNVDTHLVASATTDNAGQFSMPNLPAGTYEMRVVGWTIENADASNGEQAPVYGGSHGTGPTSIPISPGGAYTPVGPVRVLDTRAAIGVTTTTAVPPGQTVSLQVAGVAGVPATGVTGVALNVTVTEPTSAGVLTVYPDGQARPVASNLNWVAGWTVPNMVIVQVTDGKADFFNNSPGTVHIVADLAGYFSQDMTASRYTPVTPARVLDTRAAIGVSTTTAVQPYQTVPLKIAGAGGVPATGVTAVELNVTETEPSSSGVLTVYPDGQPRPVASNLNWFAFETRPNLVIVPVINGTVDFFNNSPGTVHIVADVAGYFSHDTSASTYRPVAPLRVLDTRAAIGIGTTTPLAPGQTVTLQIAGLPASGVTAAVLNVTVTEPSDPGVLTVYPADPRPLASDLNWVNGETVPNLVIVPVVNGTVKFFNNSPGTVHVVADLAGYFTQ